MNTLLKNEQGRSMVEMLGVLAVIGVLSVAGVGGYTAAMKRHRANELLNESSKRAVVIATQILSGKSISADMLNQFDNNGTTFTGVEPVVMSKELLLAMAKVYVIHVQRIRMHYHMEVLNPLKKQTNQDAIVYKIMVFVLEIVIKYVSLTDMFVARQENKISTYVVKESYSTG